VVEGITPETVRDAARQYIDTERYVRVTLLPETPAASN
jgi:predicted Zn-dependent peptidase